MKPVSEDCIPGTGAGPPGLASSNRTRPRAEGKRTYLFWP